MLRRQQPGALVGARGTHGARRVLGAFLALGVIGAALLPVPASGDDGSDHDTSSTTSDSFHDMTLAASFRPPPNDFGATNRSSDMAFWGTRAYVASTAGFRVFDISGATPALLADVRCYVGVGSGDLSVWDRDGDGTADLLVQSVDQPLAGPQCGAGPVGQSSSTGRYPAGTWEGLRLFDVGDPAQPRMIAAVYQDCGSRANTLIPRSDRLLVLNSSYPFEPGPSCGPLGAPEGRRVDHGVVQVVEVPLSDPASAAELSELPVVYPGDADGVYRPVSDHGADPRRLDQILGCHDISVFLEAGLAAASCGEQAQMWRLHPLTGLPDTENPLWVFDRDNVDLWHAGTFSWDGEIVVFSDQSFGRGCPATTLKRVQQGRDEREYATGNTFFLDARTGALLSEFRLPRTSPDPARFCSAATGAVIPSPDRYLYVSGHQSAGTSIVEFSNPRAPREVAYGDRRGAGTVAAYWYEHGESKQRRVGQLRVFSSDGVGQPVTDQNGFEQWSGRVGEVFVRRQQRLNPQLQEQLMQTHVNPVKPR